MQTITSVTQPLKSIEDIFWFVKLGWLSPKHAKYVVYGSLVFHFIISLVGGLLSGNLFPFSILIITAVLALRVIFGEEEFYRWYPVYMFMALYDMLAVFQRFIVIRPVTEVFYYFDYYTVGWLFGGEVPSYYAFEHHIAALDILFGLFYVAHTSIPILAVVYIRFFHKEHFNQLAWSSLFMATMAYLMFLFLPTAAPWYTYYYGFDPSHVGDITMQQATAGVWNTDLALGTHIFAPLMWSLTSAKFAAFPSLHVGTPAYLFFGFKHFKMKKITWFTLAYLLIIFPTVVYLNHHWFADALGGLFIGWLAVKISVKVYPEDKN